MSENYSDCPFCVVLTYPQCIVWFSHKARVWLTDRQRDVQNYDVQDRASVVASRDKNSKTSAPCEIILYKNFGSKSSTRDCVGNFNYSTVQVSVQIALLGASPKVGKFNTRVSFGLSCDVVFLGHTLRSNLCADYQVLWLKRRVFAQGWSFSIG